MMENPTVLDSWNVCTGSMESSEWDSKTLSTVKLKLDVLEFTCISFLGEAESSGLKRGVLGSPFLS